MTQITPVILCGGSGTRLWPLSRAGFPKQFLSLTGNESLFQQAAQRLVAVSADDIQVAKPLIVTGEEHRFLASEQLREVSIELGAALLEPVGRNTAPALTLAALAAQQNGTDPVLVVTPADQTVIDQVAFTIAMQNAIREAATGSIVILGITPDRPETGYGYLLREGLPPDQVIKTGSPMYEVLHHYLPQIQASSAVSRLGLQPEQYFVVSAHREENIESEKSFMGLRGREKVVREFDEQIVIDKYVSAIEQVLSKKFSNAPSSLQ